MIFYTWSQTAQGSKYDPGFKKDIEWDIPLLTGYPYVFVENISAAPGSGHYKGIDNPSLTREIIEWNPDALLVYGWNFKSHLSVMRWFHGRVPIIFRGDSTLLDERPGIKRILRRLWLRRIFSYVDIALYAGKANRDYFLAHGLKEKQLRFMPHAVDNSRFMSSEKTADKAKSLRRELLIPEKAVVFLFAGKLEEKKQPGLLAEVFSSIQGIEAYLLFAGTGELEEKLRSSYQNMKNIIFLGFKNQREMPAVYAACDVFVLPSKGPGETWGLAINEAMAAGKAVIASDACGAAYDLISKNRNGFVFQKEDGGELQKRILYFTVNPHEAKRMGIESTAIIQEYSYANDCLSVENAVNES